MTKKNRKDKTENFEKQEAAKSESEAIEPVPAGAEADESTSEATESSPDDVSMDDLLGDVRKSLIEDEKQNPKPKSSWWTPRVKSQPEEPVIEVEPIPDPVVEPEQADEYVDQIDQLIDMLDEDSLADGKPDEADVNVREAVVAAAESEPEVPINVEELKKRAFAARESDATDDVSDVRSVALGGAEDIFVEVESRKVDTREDNIKSFQNAIYPYRQYIYIIVAFLAFIVIALVSMTMYAVYQRTRPPEVVPTFNPNLPYPATLVLPGGLNFNLGKGIIADGKWNPRGPEWLQGTEICRWVAIPWSTQLEAVVRTLTQKDTIELVMNNGDRLSYSVYSIKELTLEEMQALDQNTPCLLLVLAKQDADSRWVVTALP